MPDIVNDIKIKYLYDLYLMVEADDCETVFLRTLTGLFVRKAVKDIKEFTSNYYVLSRLYKSLSKMLIKYVKQAVMRYFLDNGCLKDKSDILLNKDSDIKKIKKSYKKFIKSNEFIEIIDTKILKLNWEKNKGITNEELQIIIEKSGSSFASGFPIIEHALSITTKNFITFINEVLERVSRDKELIRTVFFPYYEYIVLSGIKCTGSDPHKNGRETVILSFITDTMDKVKLVYKPTDLTIDYLITGTLLDENKIIEIDKILKEKKSITDLERQNLILLLRRKSLITIFNENGTNCPDYHSLPTYKILPVSCVNVDTTKIDNNQMFTFPEESKHKIIQSYGYIEYLTHKEKDYYIPISKEKKAKEFYMRTGQLLALSCIFSFTDVHFQNLIVHNNLPYLIDLETALTTYVGSYVYLTGFIFSRKVEKTEISIFKGEEKNRIKYDKLTCYNPLYYLNEIIFGINAIYYLIKNNKNLYESIQGFKKQLRGVPVRVVPIGSNIFGSMLNSLYRCTNIQSSEEIIKEYPEFGTKGIKAILPELTHNRLYKEIVYNKKISGSIEVRFDDFVDNSRFLLKMINQKYPSIDKFTFKERDSKVSLYKYYYNNLKIREKRNNIVKEELYFEYISLPSLSFLLFNDRYLNKSVLDFNVPIFYHIIDTCCVYDHALDLVSLDLDNPQGFYFIKEILDSDTYYTLDKGKTKITCKRAFSILLSDGKENNTIQYYFSSPKIYLSKTLNLIEEDPKNLIDLIIERIRENFYALPNRQEKKDEVKDE